MAKQSRTQIIKDYYKAHPNAEVQDVVDYLARQNLQCDISLIHSCRITLFGKKNKGEAAKTAKKQPPRKTKKRRTREEMPEGQTKVGLIREWYQNNPDGKATDCIAELEAKHGFTVHRSNVYQAKQNMPGGEPIRKRGRKPRQAAVNSYDAILAAKEFAGSLGGIKKALEAVEKFEEMGGPQEARVALNTLAELVKK